MCTNKYSNKERYDKVIAKTKWCSFFMPHSVDRTVRIIRVRVRVKVISKNHRCYMLVTSCICSDGVLERYAYCLKDVSVDMHWFWLSLSNV